MIHSVLPLFLVATLHSSASMVGLVDGIGESIASILKLFSGALSDHLRKRKPLLVAGYGLSTVVKVLFAIATNPFTVLLARCLDRTGKGIRTAPRDALVSDVTKPEDRGAAYGLRQSLDSAGAFIGPAIAFLVLTVGANEYRTVFWWALLPGVITVSLLLFGIREPEHHVETKPGKPPLSAHSIQQLGRRFWIVFVIAIIFTLGNSSDAFILLRAKQLGVAPHTVPLILVVMNVVYAATAYPAGRLSDRFGRKGILVASFALYAAIYAGFALANDQLAIWLLAAIYGAYLGLSQGTLLALTADQVPANLRGTAFGFLNLSIGIGLLPASLLAGFLWDTVSASAAFFAGSIFALAAMALMLVALDAKPQSLTTKM